MRKLMQPADCIRISESLFKYYTRQYLINYTALTRHAEFLFISILYMCNYFHIYSVAMFSDFS